MTKVIRQQARNRGILLTYVKDGARKYKTDEVLLQSIIKHDGDIILKRANQTKNMLRTCKSIMNTVNRPPPSVPRMNRPPPPPPPVPRMNRPPPKKASPKKSKLSLMNELKAFQNKQGLKRKYNKNAKETTA